MARKVISEFRAKTCLYSALGQTYGGISIDTAQDDWQAPLNDLSTNRRYVVKVDQAVKGRYKKGLVYLDRTTNQLVADITKLQHSGYQYFLIERYSKHAETDERYMSLTRGRTGIEIGYAELGGIDIEADPRRVRHTYFNHSKQTKIGLPPATLERLITAFNELQFGFLEVNPLLIEGDHIQLLDAAVEVDAEAIHLVNGQWTIADIRSRQITGEAERAVARLNEQSQASFSLQVLNPHGRIFLLLSGGGASVVLADEIYTHGAGAELANYGEYSGNPNQAETEHYTSQILALLLASKAAHKVLIIGGGVANFTDIRATFQGVIVALRQVEATLLNQGVRIYVRRGGPNEAAGLADMRDYLASSGLLGSVHGPELSLTAVVNKALVIEKEK
jgi:succinyl-CoA synthetase beta subunit